MKDPRNCQILASALNLGHFPNFNRSPFPICSHNVIERRVLVENNFSVYAAPTYGKWERIYIIHIILKLQNYAYNRHDFDLVGFLEKKKVLVNGHGIFLSALLLIRNVKYMWVQFPYASTAGSAAQDRRTKISGQPTWRRKLYYGS